MKSTERLVQSAVARGVAAANVAAPVAPVAGQLARLVGVFSSIAEANTEVLKSLRAEALKAEQLDLFGGAPTPVGPKPKPAGGPRQGLHLEQRQVGGHTQGVWVADQKQQLPDHIVKAGHAALAAHPTGRHADELRDFLHDAKAGFDSPEEAAHFADHAHRKTQAFVTQAMADQRAAQAKPQEDHYDKEILDKRHPLHQLFVHSNEKHGTRGHQHTEAMYKHPTAEGRAMHKEAAYAHMDAQAAFSELQGADHKTAPGLVATAKAEGERADAASARANQHAPFKYSPVED